MKNLLKEKLLRGEKAMGVWQMTSSVDNSEILAHSGFDAVLIDGEHGSMDIETAGHMITAIRTTKTTPLLRVPWNDIQLIGEDTILVNYCCPVKRPRGLGGLGGLFHA